MWQDGIVENILSSPFHAQTGVSAYLAVFWSNSSHHWLSSVFLTGTPTGGSHTHSPVLRLANMCSCNWDDQIRIIFYFILLDSHVLWFSRHMLQCCRVRLTIVIYGHRTDWCLILYQLTQIVNIPINRRVDRHFLSSTGSFSLNMWGTAPT